MPTALALVLAGAGSSCASAPAAKPATATAAAPVRPAAALMMRDVRVFDGEKVLPRASVLLRGGTIATVGPDLPVPEGAEVIDGRGQTLLPGLIDAHTHIWNAEQLHQALVLGVTTELDMMTDWKLAARLRDQGRTDHRRASPRARR
ncbi:MAG TPA: hypothetical protein VFU23_01765 [Gemmatimonadales bacterium]|nr:hypothetical protein [Gemmatimonadales bacterium]